ncbi:MAG: GTP-binding protein [Candidatus Lokiarchaeota archaeon]|nr:GTP-binding protein [Candidatus Lokiarchaeota archaeon]
MSEQKDFKFKIIIIGAPNVGKTSIVQRYISGHFSKEYRSTIGTNIYTKDIDLKNGTKIKLNLWDIAGQERWRRMRHRYYIGTHGAIILGDLSRKRSFDNIVDFWYPDLEKYTQSIPIILIGNKCDLEQEITDKDIEKIKTQIQPTKFFRTSAKTGVHVDNAFEYLAKIIIGKKEIGK